MSSSLVRLDAKERIKDVFLSSLSMFLRSALIPSLFLLIRCNRARADNKDDTAKVIERLGQFINQRHGNGDTQPIGKDGFPLVYAVDRVATTALALPRATSLTYDFCNMYV